MNKIVEKQIIIDDLKINFFCSENVHNDQVLIFLHGWQSEGAHLKNIFKDCDNYIALDLPGFGKSDAPRETWGVNEYALFLKNFLKKLCIVNAILVGHSFGGSVIIKYISNGGEAKKIFLIASAGIRKRSYKIKIYKLLAKVFKLIFYLPIISGLKIRVQNFAYELIGSEDYLNAGILVESYKKIISEDLKDEMRRINVPTFIIWGDCDKATPLKNAYEMNGLIKNSKLYVIKNAGHFVFLDQTEKFNKIFKSIC